MSSYLPKSHVVRRGSTESIIFLMENLATTLMQLSMSFNKKSDTKSNAECKEMKMQRKKLGMH